MRFDMHIHSYYSADSNSNIDKIIKTAIKKKLDGISITDHNSFRGSLEALKINNTDLLIIPGAEYSTNFGHILVYFLKEGLEDIGLKKDKQGRYFADDIIACAREQNALTFIAHPFNKSPIIETNILHKIDGIEAYNSRASKWRNSLANINAMNSAFLLKKPISVGSDAHFTNEIGTAFIDLNISINDLDTLKNALLYNKNTVYGKTSSSIYKAKSQIIKCHKLNNNYLKPFAKLIYFSIKEAGMKLGIEPKPNEGVYLFKDERIERNEFNGYRT